MRKIILALLLIIAAAASYYGYHRYMAGKAAGLQASGTIEATEVNLTAKLPGTLAFVSVQAGDEVKKGQVVSRLIRNDLLAQKDRDSLGVQEAQAKLDDMVSGARTQEIDDARAAVSTAQAGYDKVSNDYQRAVALHDSGAMSQSDFEKVETNLTISQNQLQSAKDHLSILESGNRPDQIKAARILLEQSKAVLQSTQSLLADTDISSPLDGTVLTRNFEPGEYVPAGAAVVTVADLKDLWIKVYISTDDLPKIKLGQQVSYTVSGTPEVFHGTIMEIASKGEFTPKMIQTKQERTNTVYGVKVKIDNGSGIFKPGMPADVTFSQ